MPHRLKIYVVYDVVELCEELRDWLGRSDHDVACAQAGQTSMHALLEYQPNLIILGLSRYDGEGLEVYKRLNNHRQLRRIPMIVLSEDASLEYEMLDAFDFQVRPYDRDRLSVCLQRLSGSGKYLAEISFAEPDLVTIKKFLLEHSGLNFSRHNYRVLERGLMRRIQTLRMQSLPAYLNYLTATSDNYDEMNKLLGLLTVGETSFFRYRSHREALLHYVIPRILEQNKGQSKLRIWSAGCSTGEEPYSLAILLLEHFPELVDWDVQILATDINKRALRHAREGVYGERSLRMMEGQLRERYFRKVDNLFALSAPVKRMVRFDYLNLQTDPLPEENKPAGGIDLLFCRNVLIYFELETIRRVVAKFSQVLKPQSYLFLGHSETMQNVSGMFQRHYQNNAFFYQLKNSSAEKHIEKKVLPKSPRVTATPVKVPAEPQPIAATLQKTAAHQIGKASLSDPEQLYRDAVAAFDHERFTESGKLFEQLLEQQPDNPRALVGKGLILANQGKYADARSYCARAIREDDLLPEAYLLRGLILDMEGLLHRALMEYQKVLWLDPAFVMAHYLSAKAQERLADGEKQKLSLRNTIRALEQAVDQVIIPFSGGLSRGVFLEIVRRELTATTAS